ncbi:MAG: FHA domain-containing protein [Actinomycetota bacterium]|nr:FHA domain-containing protein [Actinomycetota bacterium]
MSDDPIAVLLKFGFLAVLYLFLLWVARSSLRDLGRTDEPSVVARARGGGGHPDGDGGRAAGRPRLEVIAAMGHAPGAAIDVAEGAMLGRADGSDIRIDDPFASSSHARLFPRDGHIYIEDLGSTNGTFLNGQQLRRPVQLTPSDRVRIGDTEFSYQE